MNQLYIYIYPYYSLLFQIKNDVLQHWLLLLLISHHTTSALHRWALVVLHHFREHKLLQLDGNDVEDEGHLSPLGSSHSAKHKDEYILSI